MPHVFQLMLNADEFADILLAAQQLGVSVDAWARDALREAARLAGPSVVSRNLAALQRAASQPEGSAGGIAAILDDIEGGRGV